MTTSHDGERGTMGLNEHQQRRIEVSLGIIDRTLLEIERYYLSGDSPTGEMFEISSDLEADESLEVKRLIQRFRQRLKLMRKRFHLAPQRLNLRGLLRGDFSHFWSVLHDCRSSKLKGYGAVDPELKTTLDPAIDELLTIVQQLQDAISRSDQQS